MAQLRVRPPAPDLIDLSNGRLGRVKKLRQDVVEVGEGQETPVSVWRGDTCGERARSGAARLDTSVWEVVAFGDESKCDTDCTWGCAIGPKTCGRAR